MLKVIKTKKQYENALERVYILIQKTPAQRSKEFNELEVLSVLIEKYEDEHFPIAQPEPLEAIKYVMERKGLKRSDLEKYIGHKSRVSEVLSGKRKLSLSMIRSLSKNLKIPAETLIREY